MHAIGIIMPSYTMLELLNPLLQYNACLHLYAHCIYCCLHILHETFCFVGCVYMLCTTYRKASSDRESHSDAVSYKAQQDYDTVHNMLSEALQCTSQDSLSLHRSYTPGMPFISNHAGTFNL
jgi:hypothetical protein